MGQKRQRGQAHSSTARDKERERKKARLKSTFRRKKEKKGAFVLLLASRFPLALCACSVSQCSFKDEGKRFGQGSGDSCCRSFGARVLGLSQRAEERGPFGPVRGPREGVV